MKAGLSAAFGNAATRRDPVTGEISGGFPCGPLDIDLFNELAYRATQIGIELSNLLAAVGITPSDGSLTQVSAAVRGTFNLAANGYQKLPSGLIIQWGSATVAASPASTSNSVTVNWPTAFPAQCRAALSNARSAANSSAGYLPSTGFASLSTTAGFLTVDTLTGSAASPVYINQAVNCYWLAIGY